MILKLGQPLAFTFILILCLSGCEYESRATLGVQTSPQQITDWPGREDTPRISPDGQSVAFIRTVDGNTDIFTRDIQSGETFRVTDDPASDTYPAWSPDGSKIAYRSARDGQHEIRIIGVNGDDDEYIASFEGAQIAGLDWSPDGTRLAMTRVGPHRQGYMVWGHWTVQIIDVNGGNLRELTSTGDEAFPRWGPNSEWLYYYTGLQDHIEAVHSVSGEIRSVSKGQYSGWRPNVSPDGKSVLFASMLDTTSIWIAPIDGSHSPVRVTDGDNDDHPNFFPDGNSIVFSSDRTNARIVSVELDTGQRSLLSADGKNHQPLMNGRTAFLAREKMSSTISVVDSTGQLKEPINTGVSPVVDFKFSPANDKIAVTTYASVGAYPQIFILNSTGQQSGITADVLRAETPVWCDDNETLLIMGHTHQANDSWRIWSLNTRTGDTSPITNVGTHIIRPIVCTTDAQRFEFDTISRNGRTFGAMERHEGEWHVAGILEAPSPTLSPDGSAEVFVDNRNGQTDIFVRLNDGEEMQITNDDLVEDNPRWATDGDSVVFSVSDPNRNIWITDLPELPWDE